MSGASEASHFARRSGRALIALDTPARWKRFANHTFPAARCSLSASATAACSCSISSSVGPASMRRSGLTAMSPPHDAFRALNVTLWEKEERPSPGRGSASREVSRRTANSIGGTSTLPSVAPTDSHTRSMSSAYFAASSVAALGRSTAAPKYDTSILERSSSYDKSDRSANSRLPQWFSQ
jgi:hypothetical protein